MHSSRMRTARFLSTSPSTHCSGGVFLVSSLGGGGFFLVSSRGGLPDFFPGDLLPGVGSGGCLLQCMLEFTPPCEQNHRYV